MSKKDTLSTSTTDVPAEPPTYEAATAAPTNASRLRPPFPLSLPVLQDLRSKRVILASQSPRRKQIMSYLGLPNIEIVPCTEPEDFPKTMAPIDYVLATATKKAQIVYTQEVQNEEKGEPALILAADTIVVDPLRSTIMEKPRSEAQHITMLKELRAAGDHKVYTAIVAMVPLASARQPGYAMETHIEETDVRFDSEITDELIVAYVKTREGADKAGGYGLQGLGSVLVEKVNGSYDNVIGLPLRPTLKLIERVVAKADDDDKLLDDGSASEGEDIDE